MIEAVNPLGVWSPFGAFSMAVIQGTGQIVYLKRQIAAMTSCRRRTQTAAAVLTKFFVPSRGRRALPGEGCGLRRV
jgi:hypothetical protein